MSDESRSHHSRLMRGFWRSRLLADASRAAERAARISPAMCGRFWPNNCFHCHGPDAADRKADLRLDVWESAGNIHGAEAVIDGKKPAESELLKRITSDDPDEHMPPPDSGKMLTPEQIETLQTVGEQGGEVPAALGVCRAAAAGSAGGQESRLGSQSDRCVCARAIGTRRA